ncbi:MAG TPA: non-ribosomal peptide synthetase, partial [Candidatus Dormibacteraeota bacterium]
TILVLAPPQLDLLLGRPGLERCTSLRRVIAGGDALPATLRDRFLARMKAELHNAYGPTETTIGMTFWACTPVPWEGSLPIGGPIRNVRTYVLDPRLEAVPVGVRGEIHIGGVAVTRGYLGRPDLTAERFLPDPHSPRPGARMYRSGDLGRWLPGGSLQCLGRVDDQVKLRGVRIEPQEVVARLNRHPAVRESFVCVRELGAGDDRLVAYVVPRDPAAPPSWPDVRAFLAGWLPRHLVPAAMVLLPDLPLRATGKVDRAALPPPVAEPVEAVPDAPPRTELERAIAAAWRDVLQADLVRRDDNFFDLGGHSLLLVRVHDRLRAELDPELSLLDLFQHPTVAGLAAHVGGRRPPAPGPARGYEAGRRQREALRRAAAARRGGDGA